MNVDIESEFVKGMVETITELKELKAEMLETLESIMNYTNPIHQASKEDWEESRECSECEVARKRNWPPSRTCDKHYRKLISTPERANEQEEKRMGYVLRGMAREAVYKMKRRIG